jgi:hypothetical protein
MLIRRLMAPLTLALALALAVAVLMSAGNRASGQMAGDPVLVGAGDIASCRSTGDEATAALLENIDGTVAAFGDNAYDNGSLSDYNNCYGPSWGRQSILARTKPSVGNHEYQTPGAQGYFAYFGAAAGDPQKGYYSYDLGAWHVVVLNSNCAEVSCAAGSQQEQWLRKDLADHPTACTAAYFHHPRFASSGVGSNTAVAPFWQALYDANAEVVLNGHAHNYERFAPQRPDGTLDETKGLREFIVGTGGKSLNSFPTVRKNSLVRLNDAYGVIKLTLHSNSYDWQFVTAPNATVADSGSGTCHGGTTPPPTGDTTPPTVTNTVPASGAPEVSPTTDIKATFSEDMNPSTINTTTFKLKQSGTTTTIAADVSYPDPNGPPFTAKLDPRDPLRAGTTYKAVVTVGAKDLQGNRLDQNSTKIGSQQKGWSFTVSN